MSNPLVVLMSNMPVISILNPTFDSGHSKGLYGAQQPVQKQIFKIAMPLATPTLSAAVNFVASMTMVGSRTSL